MTRRRLASLVVVVAALGGLWLGPRWARHDLEMRPRQPSPCLARLHFDLSQSGRTLRSLELRPRPGLPLDWTVSVAVGRYTLRTTGTCRDGTERASERALEVSGAHQLDVPLVGLCACPSLAE